MIERCPRCHGRLFVDIDPDTGPGTDKAEAKPQAKPETPPPAPASISVKDDTKPKQADTKPALSETVATVAVPAAPVAMANNGTEVTHPRWDGKGATNGKARFYSANKAQIIEDYLTMHERPFLAAWDMTSGTWSGVKKRWIKSGDFDRVRSTVKPELILDKEKYISKAKRSNASIAGQIAILKNSMPMRSASEIRMELGLSDNKCSSCVKLARIQGYVDGLLTGVAHHNVPLTIVTGIRKVLDEVCL